MEVDYTTDTGTSGDPFRWHRLSRLNPSYRGGTGAEDYTDNGPDTPATWQQVNADLSAAIGSSHVRIRFVFDSRDRLYNGFRGWLVDDVQVSE
jgi:hypothetical protein